MLWADTSFRLDLFAQIISVVVRRGNVCPNNICAGKSSIQTSWMDHSHLACGSHVVTCAIGGPCGVSLWELQIADWGQRLGRDYCTSLSRPKPGSKIVTLVEEEREKDNVASAPVTHRLSAAHTSVGRSGRGGRHLGSPQFGTLWSNKVQLRVTGQSRRLSLSETEHLIAHDGPPSHERWLEEEFLRSQQA